MEFTSSTLTDFSMTKVRSEMEPTGMGVLIATPSNLPARAGRVLVVAMAAPVVVGTKLAAPARPIRKFFLEGPSTMCWDAVYACTVVMMAFFIPILRSKISTTGLILLVVQLAQEKM